MGLTSWSARAKVGDEPRHPSKGLGGVASIVAEIRGWLHNSSVHFPLHPKTELSCGKWANLIPSFSKLLGHGA